jgi:hypothetical protein
MGFDYLPWPDPIYIFIPYLYLDPIHTGFRILSTFGELVRNDAFELSGWSGWCKGRWERQKSPRGCRAKDFCGTAGGDLRYGGYYGLAVFELLKLVVPGAFFAKDLGVALDLRAVGFSHLGIKDDILTLQLEFTGFVLIIRVFDEKIQTTAYGTFHFQLIQCLVFGVWLFGVWFLVFGV